MGGGQQCIECHLTHVELTLLRSFGKDNGNIHTSVTLHYDVTSAHSALTVIDTC